MDVDWLKSRKRELKVTDEALAAALGVERSVANKVVNGKVAFNARRVDEVAALLGVERDELMYRVGLSSKPAGAGERAPRPAPPVIEPVATVGIQHIDQAYGLGATFTDSHVEVEVLQFPKVWVDSITPTSPVFLTWTRGRGDSMEPTIHDGDLILLDRSKRTVDEADAIWAFTVGDVGAIKRLRVKGDRYKIMSDNASVPEDEEPIDFVNIVGRVIFVGKRK